MIIKAIIIIVLLALSSCSYNPLNRNNHLTSSPVATGMGASAGGVAVAALGGSKPMMGAGAIVGGTIGYYISSERFAEGGILSANGEVYKNGQYVGIMIPSDRLFEPNHTTFLPQAPLILDSAVAVMKRYPNHSILVSASTSGFGREKWEQTLSMRRAKKIAAYFWDAGINAFKEPGITLRKVQYTGYANYFPIAPPTTNHGIRANNRIQVTLYPACEDLHLNPRQLAMHNIGEITS